MPGRSARSSPSSGAALGLHSPRFAAFARGEVGVAGWTGHEEREKKAEVHRASSCWNIGWGSLLELDLQNGVASTCRLANLEGIDPGHPWSMFRCLESFVEDSGACFGQPSLVW